MKTIKNLKQLVNFCGEHQITAQEIVNRRVYSAKRGWADIIISPELYCQFCDEVSELFGGRHSTRAQVFNALIHSRPQHWGLSRVLLVKRGKNLGWSYCAGQDYTWELNAIRNALK